MWSIDDWKNMVGDPTRVTTGRGVYAYLESRALNEEPLSSTVSMRKVVQHHVVPFCKTIVHVIGSVWDQEEDDLRARGIRSPNCASADLDAAR